MYHKNIDMNNSITSCNAERSFSPFYHLTEQQFKFHKYGEIICNFVYCNANWEFIISKY